MHHVCLVEINRVENNMKKFVVLTGGLGNQLFQIAGALSSTTEPINVVSCLGNPRRYLGKLEISELNFGGQILVSDCNRNHRIVKRMFSLMISSATRRKFLQNSLLGRFALSTLGSIIFSFHLRYPVCPRVSIGIGKDDSFKLKKGNLFIGYFQTFEMNERARDSIHTAFHPVIPIKSLPNGKKPDLVIHSRLGDYKNERGFGVLSEDYFASAISLLEENTEIEIIWLFSDEPKLALELMPTSIRKRIEIIGGEDDAPSKILKTMMQGSSFIISNSTFSWWSALLSESKLVIVPKPWFVSGEEPNKLIPKFWRSVDRS
jgi:hypothetical protein